MADQEFTDPSEIWKPIPGYEGWYEASSLGRIRRIKVRIRKRADGGRGYPVVSLWNEEGVKTISVHRLVALTFLGPPETPEHQVNHKNFDKADARPENLEWVTPRENILHARDAGRLYGRAQASKGAPRKPRKPNPSGKGYETLRGEQCKYAKITENDVREIRKLLTEDVLLPREIGEMFGVARSQVVRIGNRTRWSHVE